MANIKDSFYKLKSSIIGIKTTKTDDLLDDAIKDISAYRSNSGRTGYIDLVRSVLSKNASVNNKSLVDIIYSKNSQSPQTLGQSERISRYAIYESIVGTISYCKRALKTLVDNILAPDDITKISIEVKSKTFSEDKTQSEIKVKRVKQIIKDLKIEKYLSNIVENTLKYGDFFCEIADSKTALTSRAILAERKEFTKNENIDYLNINTKINKNQDISLKININYLSLYNEFVVNEESENNTKKIYMLMHDASKVVKLQSENFPLCFGYLVFPSVTNQVSIYNSNQDDAINDICSSILASLEKQIPNIDDISKKRKDDLKNTIRYLLQQSDLEKSINVRYVPENRMQHFMSPSTKYTPYGESIFDSSQFTGKVLIALETALAVNRLSRSTEKRKISVELGLPRDARRMIEKLKEEFRKRKISLDSFGTVDTIPSLITTFEDIYIPQKDGKPFVDIGTFNEGNVDIRGKVDELKFLRDQLVADLGVPPAFLGIEENSVVKNTLTEENVLFARTVIGHQKYLTEQIFSLIQKVMNITNPVEALDLEDDVLVSLPTPKSLQFERQSKYMGDLANLIESLKRLGIPEEYSKKKYLPDIDWDEVNKYDIDKNIDKELGTGHDEDTGGTFGGGGMGGTY